MLSLVSYNNYDFLASSDISFSIYINSLNIFFYQPKILILGWFLWFIHSLILWFHIYLVKKKGYEQWFATRIKYIFLKFIFCNQIQITLQRFDLNAYGLIIVFKHIHIYVWWCCCLCFCLAFSARSICSIAPIINY